jgi:hypothetical protein
MLIVLMVLLNRFLGSVGIFLVALAYLTYSYGSRYLLTPAHRRGVRLMKAGRFQEAAEAFKDAVAYFRRHP